MKKFATLALSALVGASCIGMAVGCGEKPVFGKELIKLDSQLDTLVSLDKGDIDVSIIDSVMAGYYTSNGDYKDKMQIVDGLTFSTEQYGIAGRKEDKAFISEINKALIAMRTEKYTTVAEQFGLKSELAVTAETTDPLAGATDDSWDKIKSSGKIVIGYTVFAPIAYTDNASKFTGFDIELAREVVNYLNTTYTLSLEVEFQEINWDAKETLLSGGSIDLIWNGLTITEERSSNLCISVPYLNNRQVAVIRKADASKYTSKESMADAILGVEGGSAGEDVALGKIGN